MREIIFRGRDVITGNWAYGFYYPSKGHAIIRDANDNECIVLPETVGRFTGLNDKNRKKIYEGDIVEYKITRMFWTPKESIERETVFISDGICNVSPEYIRMCAEDCAEDVGAAVEYLEVIGNIYQNQGLAPRPS